MAQLLVILMVVNMLGAVTLVPAFYSIVRPRFAGALHEEVEASHAAATVETAPAN